MLLIGLTGGIASGKTLVSDTFAELGVPIVDADILAREVVEPGSVGLNSLISYFTATILTPDGELDRKALREIIFRNSTDRRFVDETLHPLIRKRADEEIARHRSQGADYLIYTVPLLVETNQHEKFDRILLVDVPVEIQLSRLISRDNTTREQAQSIIDAQASREKRQAIATDIILNDGNIKDVTKQIHKLHKLYLQLSSDHMAKVLSP